MRKYGMHLYNRREPSQPTRKPSTGRRQQERDLAGRRTAATVSCCGAAAGGGEPRWVGMIGRSGLEEEEVREQRCRRLAVGGGGCELRVGGSGTGCGAVWR